MHRSAAGRSTTAPPGAVPARSSVPTTPRSWSVSAVAAVIDMPTLLIDSDRFCAVTMMSPTPVSVCASSARPDGISPVACCAQAVPGSRNSAETPTPTRTARSISRPFTPSSPSDCYRNVPPSVLPWRAAWTTRSRQASDSATRMFNQVQSFTTLLIFIDAKRNPSLPRRDRGEAGDRYRSRDRAAPRPGRYRVPSPSIARRSSPSSRGRQAALSHSPASHISRVM